jgi:hypothetical protein
MAAVIATILAMPSVSSAAALALADPVVPGETLPPLGQSLFDDLFRSGAGHALPYPFERLSQSVTRHNGGVAPREVLIPMGRSLQRLAADPDYFASPRVVLGVAAAGGGAARNLKDRLFIGYQARSASMEVISYNEAAGRFEFQVVSNYTGKGKPLVEYAERSVCTGCHQGQAPIFPIAQWNETNANPAIAARMTGLGAVYHGVPVRRGIDEPDALDQAVGRANRLVLAQFIWRRACAAAPGMTPEACRGRLLLAALRWRLGGARGPWRASGDDDLAAALHAALAHLAPDGVGAADPSLPDRNPLIALDAGARPMDAVEPEGVYDPARPRALRMLSASSDPPTDVLAAAVAEIGGFLPPATVARLAAALSAHAGAAAVFGAPCPVDLEGGEIRFDCAAGGVSVAGYVAGGSGMVTRLALAGHAPLGNLTARADGRGGLHLTESAQGLPARLATGERLSPLRLANGRAEITVTDDIAPLRRAVASLDLADGGSLRTTALVDSLLAVLGKDAS